MQIQTSITKKTGEDKATVRATERASKPNRLPTLSGLPSAHRVSANLLIPIHTPDLTDSTKLRPSLYHQENIIREWGKKTDSRFRMQIRSVENNSIIEKFRSFKQDNMIFFSQIFLRSIFKFLLKFNKNFMIIFIISPFQTKIPYIC